jgi:hypothetical protein
VPTKGLSDRTYLPQVAEDDEDELSAGYLLLASISVATSTAASMQRRSPICEVCGCSSCPEGDKVGKPEGVIPLPSSDQLPVGLTEVPCSLLDFAGSSGQIAEVDCNDDLRLIPELRSICGCPDLPVNATTTAAGDSVVKAVGSDGQFGTDGDSDPIAVVSPGKSKKIGKKEKDKDKSDKERLYKTAEDEKSATGKTTDKIYQAAENSEKSKSSKGGKGKGGKGKSDKDSEDERTDETGKDGQFGTDGRKRRQLTLRVPK